MQAYHHLANVRRGSSLGVAVLSPSTYARTTV